MMRESTMIHSIIVGPSEVPFGSTRLVIGQLDHEGRALAGPGRDDDLAAVLADDLLRDGQAQPGAAGALGRGEDLEDRGDLGLVDADAVVADADPGDRRLGVPLGLDRRPGRSARPRRRRWRW